MRDSLKAIIDGVRIHLDLTIEEVIYLKDLLKKDVIVDGIPSEEGCVCPECHTALIKGKYHCPLCGQRVRYIESDNIPL